MKWGAGHRGRLDHSMEAVPFVAFDCEDALLVARDLIRAGLQQVHVFKGGWKQWQEAGLPEEQG